MKYSLRSYMAALCVLASASVFADEALLEKARELSAKGKVVEAYQLLLGEADNNAGDPEFDYLFATTAIDAGVPLQAVFPLERVLDTNPDNAAARAELARAFFLIGENEAARSEFKKARQSDMPARAGNQIDSYLSEIDARILGSKERSAAYLEFGGGADSNVNSATGSAQITVPTGTFNVNLPEKYSVVGRVETGASFVRALKTNLNLYGSGKLEFYQPSDASEFATRDTDGTLGLHLLRGREQYRIALVAQNYAVERATFRNLFGFNLLWQHTYDANDQISLFGQFAALEYKKVSALDTNQYAIGVSWVHSFASEYQPILYLTSYIGVEDEKDTNNPSAGRDYYGVRIGASLRTSASLSWGAVMAYQSSEYHGPDIFMITRNDDYFDLRINVNHVFAKNWELRPEISYTKNDSNSVFSSYTRSRAMLNVRREF